jgi:hypothetical protein
MKEEKRYQLRIKNSKSVLFCVCLSQLFFQVEKNINKREKVFFVHVRETFLVILFSCY